MCMKQITADASEFCDAVKDLYFGIIDDPSRIKEEVNFEIPVKYLRDEQISVVFDSLNRFEETFFAEQPPLDEHDVTLTTYLDHLEGSYRVCAQKRLRLVRPILECYDLNDEAISFKESFEYEYTITNEDGESERLTAREYYRLCANPAY